jgi:hypothetical protein
LNVSCIKAGPAFQRIKLPAKAHNFIVEFGGFAAAAIVGNRGNNDGGQTHHHPP